MYDRDDERENPEEKSSKGVDPMRRFANQLILLEDFCKRLAADRETWALTGVEFSDKVEEIKKVVEELKTIPSEMKRIGSEMNKNLIQLLIEENRRSAETIAKGAGQIFQKTITAQVDENIRKLDNAFVNTSNRLDGYESRWKDLPKWVAGIGFAALLLAGLISGGVVTHYFPPLDKQQEARMSHGAMIEDVWDHLTQQERDRITYLANKPAK